MQQFWELLQPTLSRPEVKSIYDIELWGGWSFGGLFIPYLTQAKSPEIMQSCSKPSRHKKEMKGRGIERGRIIISLISGLWSVIIAAF